MAKHEKREAQQDALGRTSRLPTKKPQVQTLEQGTQQIVGIKKEARDVAIYMDSQFAGKSSSNTLSQWEAVKTACANAVEGIRNIVGDSVSLLEDLTVFTEYLRTPKDTPEEKSKQIQDYMDFLTRKSENAQATLEQLRLVLDRLKRFQGYWPSNATEYTKELAPRLKVIRDNINNLLQKPIIVTVRPFNRHRLYSTDGVWFSGRRK
ncbi:hypothetical protein SCHPADRAFT_363075 [Schizopora paradoxa]|uniref:Uncharacterized protein n=1 Tax=Schizopora paradoxa TaxID=27342 RepID=A0A0H2RNE1_9AGAM|nr:hypothetical protein SCHPADRAFT_363075 [Schizopora paradoxa]